MKRRVSEAAVGKIMSHLLERFGEPIGKSPDIADGVADERSGHPTRGQTKKMGNRGFGAKFEGRVSEAQMCHQCHGMMDMGGEACTNCGEMPKALPPAGGTGAEEVIVVVGGHKSPRGATPGATSGRFAAGVHPPKDMTIPPEAMPKKGKPSAPSAPPSRPVPKEMPTEMDGDVTGGPVAAREEGVVREGRFGLSPQEVLTTWEDLYVDSLRQRRKTDDPAGPAGVVSLESLASWLAVPPEAVKNVLHKAGLLLDKSGNVVSRGHTPAPGTIKAVKT